MQIYCMRHGHTNYNVLGLCNDNPGRDVHLTPQGEVQAQRAAEALRTTPLNIIFTSQLPRTQQTAMIINRYHQIPVQVHEDINDICSGFDGLSVRDYKQAIAADPLQTRVNGGESLLDHKARVLRFIRWLATQAHANVLVVAHEETLRVFEGHYHQLPDSEMIELHFDNCEVLHYRQP